MKRFFSQLVMGMVFVYSPISAALPAGKPGIFGAEIFSQDEVTYGKFEFRMKTPYNSGVLATFFLYDGDSWQGRPFQWGEIDIEVLSKQRNLLQTNLLTGFADKRKSSEVLHNLPFALSEGFHTYTLIWTPYEVSWFVDGLLLRRSSDEQVAELRDQALSYRFNLWASEAVDWVGPFDGSRLPVFQQIDWISYSSYTGDPKQPFRFEWIDQFDFLNLQRWGLADWTFDGNLVFFRPENVFLGQGMLHLMLSY